MTKIVVVAFCLFLGFAAQVFAQEPCFFGPSTPTSFSVRIDQAQTVFTWNASGGFGCTIAGYWLVLSRVPGGNEFPTFVTATTATFIGPPVARFYARVYAVDTTGRLSPSSAILTLDPPGPPPPPVPPCERPPDRAPFFTATVNSFVYYDLTLRWSVPTTNCAPTHVEITAGPSGIIQHLILAEHSGIRTEYVATTREAPPGTYYLRLRFANEYGFGPFSPEQIVIVQPRACGFFTC